MKQLIFALSLFITFLTFPSAPTPYVSQAVGLHAASTAAADVKTLAAQAQQAAPTPSGITTNREKEQKKFIAKFRLRGFHIESGWKMFDEEAQWTPQNIIEKIKGLLALGFDVNKPIIGRGLNGQEAPLTLLHRAAHISLEVTKFLIEAGANVNAVDDLNATPAHWAASNPEEKGEIIIALINAGANMNIGLLPGTGYYDNKTVLELALQESPLKTSRAISALVELSEQDITGHLQSEERMLEILQNIGPAQHTIQRIRIGLANRQLRKQHEAFIADLTKGTSDQPFATKLLPPLWKLIFTLAGRPIIYSFQEPKFRVIPQS
jgi:hypothetical protein